MNIVVIGGSGGIGSALLRQIQSRYPQATIFATYHESEAKKDLSSNTKTHWSQLDVTSEESIRSYAMQFDKVNWLISAVGFLHHRRNLPEKSIEQVDPDFFLRNLQVNALSALLIAKHFKRSLKHNDLALLAVISAKVGSIEDNRLGGWHSYRCSKAALNMAIKNISIEWRRSMPNVCVTALHPGTTDTSLSQPFQRNVPQGKLFTPDYTAECLVNLLSQMQSSDSGRFLAYDGTHLPW